MATSLDSHVLHPSQEQPEQQPHQIQQSTSSPPTSNSSSPPSVSHRPSALSLSLDLSTLPALIQPSPPSNTLLITQLNDTTIFHPASLATIRQHINSLFPLHSFSPLKSFRRIVCSFYDVESAIRVRQHLDGAPLLGDVRTRIYFGEPTPIGEQKKYLDRPDAGRLFFISPPPSPPVGWEAREEDPPNKDVVASDLAAALGKLSSKMHQSGEDDAADDSPGSQEENPDSGVSADERTGETKPKPPKLFTGPEIGDSSGSKPHSAGGAGSAKNRSRSSTVIYDPETHGDSPALPAVMVEDTTMDDMDEDEEFDDQPDVEAAIREGTQGQGRKTIAHTSRPPVELMEGT